MTWHSCDVCGAEHSVLDCPFVGGEAPAAQASPAGDDVVLDFETVQRVATLQGTLSVQTVADTQSVHAREERYSPVEQWRAEAEINRQAWLKAEQRVATLTEALRTIRAEAAIYRDHEDVGGAFAGIVDIAESAVRGER